MQFSLKNLFGNAVDKVIDSVGNAIDKNVTSKEERDTLRNDIVDILTKYQNSLDDAMTTRLQIDANSDSWLTKNVRPLSLIYTTGVVTVLALTDGNIGKFVIQGAYITLFQTLLVMQYAFYFGSRGIEKVIEKYATITNNRKKK